jgi:hypothetical protein
LVPWVFVAQVALAQPITLVSEGDTVAGGRALSAGEAREINARATSALERMGHEEFIARDMGSVDLFRIMVQHGFIGFCPRTVQPAVRFLTRAREATADLEVQLRIDQLLDSIKHIARFEQHIEFQRQVIAALDDYLIRNPHDVTAMLDRHALRAGLDIDSANLARAFEELESVIVVVPGGCAQRRFTVRGDVTSNGGPATKKEILDALGSAVEQIPTEQQIMDDVATLVRIIDGYHLEIVMGTGFR